MELSPAFDPAPSLLGGALIGASASLVWWSLGRTAGVSGIWARALSGGFQTAFLAGLLAGGFGARWWVPEVFSVPSGRTMAEIAISGLLVGLGARMSSGCTSGHGVCGLSRRSPRSLAAVLTFMAVAAVSATAMGASR